MESSQKTLNVLILALSLLFMSCENISSPQEAGNGVTEETKPFQPQQQNPTLDQKPQEEEDPAPPPPSPPPTSTSSLGTNLTELNDYSGEFPFTDLFKTARPWLSGERFGCWDCGAPLDLDDAGWVRSLAPGQVANTVVVADLPNRFPSGTYDVFYDGEGELTYFGSATKNIAASSPGHDVVEVNATDGNFILSLLSTNTLDSLRNIRIFMPSVDPTQRFHPTFLNNTSPYRVIRFMDWMRTNNSDVVELSDYSHVNDAVWPHAPIEVMVELANILHADPWFTIPHQASDAFVREFAERVLDGLDPERKVYIEYSNEVWNLIFSQYRDVAIIGCNLYPDLQASCGQCVGHPWPTWNPACDTAAQRRYSDRTVEIGEIFVDVFGGTERLVRVLASQTGNDYLHEQYLSWNNNAQFIDVLATAPYFGGELGGDASVATWPLDQLFTALQTSSVPEALDRVAVDAQFLASHYPGIPLIAYEGGQHLAGSFALANNQSMTDLFMAANADPRMGELYDEYLSGWLARGGTLFVHFNNVSGWSKWGSWGTLQYQDQEYISSPKFEALLQFLEENPIWWED